MVVVINLSQQNVLCVFAEDMNFHKKVIFIWKPHSQIFKFITQSYFSCSKITNHTTEDCKILVSQNECVTIFHYCITEVIIALMARTEHITRVGLSCEADMDFINIMQKMIRQSPKRVKHCIHMHMTCTWFNQRRFIQQELKLI